MEDTTKTKEGVDRYPLCNNTIEKAKQVGINELVKLKRRRFEKQSAADENGNYTMWFSNSINGMKSMRRYYKVDVCIHK